MTSSLRFVLALFAAFIFVPDLLWAKEPLAVLPAQVQLDGPEARQRLLVLEVHDGVFQSQQTEGLEWQSSNEQVVVVRDGFAVPVANGEASLTVYQGERTATATVVVKGMGQPHSWSFRNHVEPILARTGCNSGACHGALAGKGGFKLSLHGYDPAADFHTITRQARGRRIEFADPGRSLLLAKPSGAIPHKGGLRFDVDSLEYRVIAEWIAAGADRPTAEDARLDRLEILPEAAFLKPGATAQAVVRAWYSDGRVEDVTRWAKFRSTDDTVAQVNEQGQMTVVGSGEGAVTAWFSSRIVIARVTVPYPFDVPVDVYTQSPRRNFIDDQVLTKLQSLHLRPSPRSTDEEFLRRAFLDTIGTLPTVDEVRAFLADASPDKRDNLIEALLARPEFVDYWTYKWSDMLLLNGQKLRPAAVKSYYTWIHDRVAENTPWDEFVRRIVTSQGSSLENGATNFYALHQDPETMAENVSQAFLGLSIGCAKCHNHPLEKWTNNQYYGFANLFSRVRAKGWGGDFRSGDGTRTLYVAEDGELIQPLTGKPQPPTPLDGTPIAFDSPADRRIELAAWLTAPENPYFTRAITNRVWANFFGVGLIEEIDDLRVSNPASNEPLLAAAAAHLIEHKYDLKGLIRTILQSETYQRSSLPLPENQDEKRFYSRYYPKRLMAEVMLDAISQATAVPTDFTEIGYPGADKEKTAVYPKGTKALQLYDSAVVSYFLKTFGRNQRQITCECERTDEPSMVQILHLSNGDTINEKLKSPDSRLQALLAANKTDAEIIEEAYLVALSRFPTEEEKARILAVLAEAEGTERRLLLEDVFWSILSSREFLFNH